MADRLALIIANSEFADPKLTRLATPSRDAKALAGVLSDPDIGGFDVTLLEDETERSVRTSIARFFHRRNRNDLLLLYYSGHGIRDEYSGGLCLATRDTEVVIARATALNAAFVSDEIDRSNSQRKVVVLDCCHSGAFAEAKAALGSSAGTQEALAGNGYGRVILTASNALEFAWEGDKLLGEAETSVFTHFLVEGLRTGAADLDADGQISLDELYEYVYDHVVASSKQTPQKSVLKVEGQITIARNPYAVAKSKDTMTWPKDGKEMVRVPAGVFLYGDDKQEVELPEFWIDKTPVTNAEYVRFVADTGYAPPAHWKGKTPPQKIADHPVTYVSWYDAVAYAKWAGKRLPTEQEWEKAARGINGRTYPWGEQEPTPELCNFGGNVGGTTPVGQYSPQGDSPYGCVDMAGNVWEWTASDFDNRSKVLRGGSWVNIDNFVRSAYRSRYLPVSRYGSYGFRCVGASTPSP